MSERRVILSNDVGEFFRQRVTDAKDLLGIELSDEQRGRIETLDTSALTNPRISFAYQTTFPDAAGAPTNTSNILPSGAGVTTGVWDTQPTTWSSALDTNDTTNYVGTATRHPKCRARTDAVAKVTEA